MLLGLVTGGECEVGPCNRAPAGSPQHLNLAEGLEVNAIQTLICSIASN